MNLPQSVVNDIARRTENVTSEAVNTAVGGVVRQVVNIIEQPANDLQKAADSFKKTAADLRGMSADPEAIKGILDRFRNDLKAIQFPDPPKPDEVINWLRGLGQDVFTGLQKQTLWIRIDGKLVIDPAEMYTEIVSAVEKHNKSFGDTTTIDVGGAVGKALGTFIIANSQTQSVSSVIINDFGEALRKQGNLLDKKVLKVNPGEEVIITAIICATLVALGLGIPIVVGGSAVFFGIAIAIVVAVAMGNEIDVSASNPLKFKFDPNDPQATEIEVGPIVTFEVRKAHSD